MANSPDIVFLVLDTQRADRLGAYGHEKAQTPNFDKFAAEAALFELGISPAQWTIPSHASMFTGLYPTAHQVTQSHNSLSKDRPHVAEVMQSADYETIAFCNNPLVGILDNGFDRGFDTFHNYGGASPNAYRKPSTLPKFLQAMRNGAGNAFRKFAIPIQNFFGKSDLALRISLSAWATPIWSRLGNFKGQNERSINDVADYLQAREGTDKPLFLFINLMQTHLPFTPPKSYVDKIAPYMKGNKAAWKLMGKWNREAYRWAAPLDEPLGELEANVLSDMYDAEVAYQDAYLGTLFAALAKRDKANNTLTIIVGDHGDGLGEHDFMGHAFNAYQELVHVPLVMHWPSEIEGERIKSAVSTRRVYHTMLETLDRIHPKYVDLSEEEIGKLSLRRAIEGKETEASAFAEVYPPLNFVKAVEHRQPSLLERFRCLSLKQAVVQTGHKLISVDGEVTELFDLGDDPLELKDVLEKKTAVADTLKTQLTQISGFVNAQRDKLVAGDTFDPESDAKLLQHLRALGYIE